MADASSGGADQHSLNLCGISDDVMTLDQCLARAGMFEHMAAGAPGDAVRGQYARLAAEWRSLALAFGAKRTALGDIMGALPWTPAAPSVALGYIKRAEAAEALALEATTTDGDRLEHLEAARLWRDLARRRMEKDDRADHP